MKDIGATRVSSSVSVCMASPATLRPDSAFVRPAGEVATVTEVTTHLWLLFSDVFGINLWHNLLTKEAPGL